MAQFQDATWWRHQMETFFAVLAICAGNSPVTSGFPLQRPVTQSFDISFELRLNTRLSKQWWGWWFETPLRPLRRHCNDCAWWNHSSDLQIHHAVWSTDHRDMLHVLISLSSFVNSVLDGRDLYYRHVPNISRTLVSNKIVDHSDVVGI